MEYLKSKNIILCGGTGGIIAYSITEVCIAFCDTVDGFVLYVLL